MEIPEAVGVGGDTYIYVNAGAGREVNDKLIEARMDTMLLLFIGDEGLCKDSC